MPDPTFRTFSAPGGATVNGVAYVLDTNSGVFRPVYSSDLGASVSVSGLSLSVGAVNLTGQNVVTLTGVTPVSVTNGVVPVSGAVSVTFPSAQNVNVVNTPFVTLSASSVTVANTAPMAISGVVNTVVTGAVSASFDTAPIVSAEASGNAFLANLSGRFNATMAPLAVSGTFNATTDNTTVVQAVGSGNAFLNSLSGRLSPTMAPLAISGVVQTSVTTSNVDVVAALTTGNAYLLQANRLHSGISGLLASNLTEAAWVTGQVSLTNTAPIPVSGVTILGATATTQITGWNTGLKVRFEPVTSLTTSNATPSGVSPWTSMSTGVWTNQTGQIFAANPARAMFFIQNIHTGVPLYVALNSNAASTGNFSFILNPSTQQGWGGSSFSDDHYRGAVCVSGGGWTAWEV